MPKIHAIPALGYAVEADGDVSTLIAPPYDVLDEASKKELLSRNPHNIVAIDLPHLPAKTVGPDATYQRAGSAFRSWLSQGILQSVRPPCCYVYRQTFSVAQCTYQRLGLMANLMVTPLGARGHDGDSAIFPHEQTFSEPKEDRLKLTRATQAQLSPIFGLFSDHDGQIGALMNRIAAAGPAALRGTTENDGVRHELWAAPDETDELVTAWDDRDVFIADGHHRYNTALNYLRERSAAAGALPGAHRTNFCMFVLVSMQDPGMVILPTHRVLGGMKHFTMESFVTAATGRLAVEAAPGSDLPGLEAALEHASPHAIGLYCAHEGRRSLAIATTLQPDPLLQVYPNRCEAWRHLDPAIARHLIVEQICEPNFCPDGGAVRWAFPHTLDQLQSLTDGENFQLGLVMRATSLQAVRRVSEAGDLMPPKSTFFYPKLATGLLINPVI